jgi:DNA-binding Xre family transcriptional regulator
MFNAKKFNDLIEKSGLTAEQLAEKSGISRQMIWLLKDGRSTDIKISTLTSLAEALEVDPSELMVEVSAA